MTPQEFWDACERHDWFHDFSDDARVASRGHEAETKLKAQAPLGSENRKIFDGFKLHHFSGSSFGNPKATKPERPQ